MPDDESIRLPAEETTAAPRRRVADPLPLETEPRPVTVPEFVPVEPVAPSVAPVEPVPSISSLPIDSASPAEIADAAPARARTSTPPATGTPLDTDDNANFANRDVERPTRHPAACRSTRGGSTGCRKSEPSPSPCRSSCLAR